jgi:hypothetical protein
MLKSSLIFHHSLLPHFLPHQPKLDGAWTDNDACSSFFGFVSISRIYCGEFFAKNISSRLFTFRGALSLQRSRFSVATSFVVNNLASDV